MEKKSEEGTEGFVSLFKSAVHFQRRQYTVRAVFWAGSFISSVSRHALFGGMFWGYSGSARSIFAHVGGSITTRCCGGPGFSRYVTVAATVTANAL